MGQITIRADDELIGRVKQVAAESGRSMNEWTCLVLDAATDPDLAGDEVARLRERLRLAGLLYEPEADPRGTPVDPERLARARAALGGGEPVSEIVLEGRG